MNGSHYEWFAARGAGWDVWKNRRECSNGMAEEQMTLEVQRDEKGATAISRVQWKVKNSVCYKFTNAFCLPNMYRGKVLIFKMATADCGTTN